MDTIEALAERLGRLDEQVRDIEKRCERAAVHLKESHDHQVQAAGRELNETTRHD